MIGFLRGRVVGFRTQAVLLDVGGVGYVVQVGAQLRDKLSIDDHCALHIETLVREDSITLFGFEDESNWARFLLLVTVQGVGARLALSILDYLSPDQLVQAIEGNMPQLFKPVPGVGPKLAARLVTELKGKNVPGGNADRVVVSNRTSDGYAFHQDLVSALLNLGFAEAKIKQVLERSYQNEPNATFEDVLRLALKELGHG
jgi:Holliday junction DNA helicase, RuvA subunit